MNLTWRALDADDKWKAVLRAIKRQEALQIKKLRLEKQLREKERQAAKWQAWYRKHKIAREKPTAA